MHKLKLVLSLFLLTLGLVACATPQNGQSADQQRARAAGAQGELSSEVHK